MSTWQQALTEGAIEGAWLKFVKGNWLLGGAPVEAGRAGLKVIVLMPTATHGAVHWEDGKITERQLIPYEDALPSGDVLQSGWSPNTSFQCVGANGIHAGILATFASTSWGSRNAFSALIAPYARKRELEFPVVTLGSQARQSGQYSIIEPSFGIVAWAPRTEFAALVQPLEEKIVRLEAPAALHQTTAELIGDSIPF